MIKHHTKNRSKSSTKKNHGITTTRVRHIKQSYWKFLKPCRIVYKRDNS